MRNLLNDDEISRLKEIGMTGSDGLEIRTLADLLKALPAEVEVYRYRPEARWKNMSDPTYSIGLYIEKNDGEWRASYEGFNAENPDLSLDYRDNELIVALYKLAEAYATAPEEWVKHTNN